MPNHSEGKSMRPQSTNWTSVLLTFGASVGWLASPSLFSNSVRAQDSTPLIKQINNVNWLDDAEAKSLVDELFYQRAVHAYMTMLPALNTIGMRDGSEKEFGAGYNVLPIWKDRMDSRCWV